MSNINSGIMICPRCAEMIYRHRYKLAWSVTCNCGNEMVPIQEEVYNMWRYSEYCNTMPLNEFVSTWEMFDINLDIMFTSGYSDGPITGCVFCKRCDRVWFYYGHAEPLEDCGTCGGKFDVIPHEAGKMWYEGYRRSMSISEFLRKLGLKW